MEFSIDGGLVLTRNDEPRCDSDKKKDIEGNDCGLSFTAGLEHLRKEWSFGLLMIVTNLLIIFVAIFLQGCERNVISEVNADDEFLTLTNPRQKMHRREIDMNENYNNGYLTDAEENGDMNDCQESLYQEITNDYGSFYSCPDNDPPYDQILVLSEEIGYINPDEIEMSVIVHKPKETAV